MVQVIQNLLNHFFQKDMYLCNNCTDQFKTEEALKAHIREVHIMARISDFKIPNLLVKKAEKAVNEKDLVVHPGEIKIVEKDVQKKLERKPIELKYVYEGDCNICGIPVETHEIIVPDGVYQVCWCGNCRKQLTQLKVIPIEKQVLNNQLEKK